jgi:streptogramin lyase
MVQSSVRALTARVVFKGPGLQVNGLEAVPEGLWVADQRDDTVYLIDYEGEVLTRFPGPTRNASGISFGSGWVWVAHNQRPSMVYRHDPKTGHCTAGLHLPNANEGGVHGIQWMPYGPDDRVPDPPPAKPELHPTAAAGKPNAGPGASGTLWVTRPGQKVLDHIDAETGELLRQIPFPMPRSHGLYWQDGTLCVAETNGGHVFRLDPKDGTVLDEFQIAAPGGIEVHGMTRSADGRIWVGDAATNQISVVEP